MSNPKPRHVLAKFIAGIFLTCWPVPICVWFSASMVGWKVALIIFGISYAAVAGFVYGLKLLREL